MNKWVLVLSLGLSGLLSGCTQKAVAPLDLSRVDTRPAIIFVPGYYGSALQTKEDKKRIFATAGQILFNSKSMSLHNADLQTPPAYDLEVEGLLNYINVVPGIYSVDAYGKFVQAVQDIATKSDAQLIAFSYDWREDLPTAAAQLAQVIEQLQKKGVHQIDIVAHSMGGMVTAYYLGYGAQSLDHAQLNWQGARQIRKVAFLGTPFRGLYSIFRNMQRGADLGGNRSLLPPGAVSSFPSSYYLLPYDTASWIAQAQEIKMDMANFELWQKENLGLLNPTGFSADILQKRRNYTQSELRQGKIFTDLILFKKAPVAPPTNLAVLNVIGKGSDTVDTAYYSKEKHEFIFDTDDKALKENGLKASRLKKEGDGTVTISSAQLPEALAVHAQLLYTKEKHTQLIKDAEVRQVLEVFLR